MNDREQPDHSAHQHTSPYLAHAVVDAARERAVPLPAVTAFTGLPGRGAQTVVAERMQRVGGPRLLEQEEITAPDALRARVWGERGRPA